MIKAIVAMDLMGGIGLKNRMPWYFPEDLKYFKAQTMGHDVLMGRKTFESIGKPLIGRHNYVLTNNKKLLKTGDVKSHSYLNGSWLSTLLSLYKTTEPDLWIMGGAEVYNLLSKYIDEWHITRIHQEFKCDTFLDIGLFNDFIELDKEIRLDFTHYVFRRK